MKEYFFDIWFKVKNSFLLSLKGKEELRVIIRWWGILGYLFFYFVVSKLVRFSDFALLNYFFSILAILYFSWHIFALKKCEPKKKKPSKEEKQQRRKDLPKRFLRKLFLQEPVTQWNTVTVLIALDLLYILMFFDNLTG